MRLKFILLLTFVFSLIYVRPAEAQTGIITTIAGFPTGSCGYNGDGIPAVAAQLHVPIGITMDSVGNIYFSDHINNRIRKINTAGIISTVAGDGTVGYTGDGGNATDAKLDNPTGVAVDHSGNLYFADEQNNAIRKVSSSGIITTISGNGTSGYSGDGAAATAATLYLPYEMTIDPSGNLYIVDQDNNAIRKINTAGVISTFAGTGVFGYSGDGGPATAAQVYYPTGITSDAAGNIYIADRGNNLIRKVNTSGIITSVAGTNFFGYSGDGGPATAAQLSFPSGVTVDRFGNIFFSDSYNYRVRMVNTAGIISTVAGDGVNGLSGDGGPATLASLSNPMGVVIDDSENLYIADANDCVIRKVKIMIPGTLGVTQLNNSSNSNISIFPDPNNGNFTVKCSLNSGMVSQADEAAAIEITDMMGRIVYKTVIAAQNGTINKQIELAGNLPEGLYILNLRSDAQTSTARFVIQK